MVIHANHANELRDAPGVREALSHLRANGTVGLNQSVLLVAGLAERLPGCLVPRLVREEPGAAAKTMLAPASR